MEATYAAIDRALGRNGATPRPLETGFNPRERDELLRGEMIFPDEPLPTGELAEWALVLLDLEKECRVQVALKITEKLRELTVPGPHADAAVVDLVLDAIRNWVANPDEQSALQRLGDLWWSTLRDRPPQARTPLSDTAFVAWFAAGFDPEGWGCPPEDPVELQRWLKQAADNRGAIVDVLGQAQHAVDGRDHGALLERVRGVVSAWRDRRRAIAC